MHPGWLRCSLPSGRLGYALCTSYLFAAPKTTGPTPGGNGLVFSLSDRSLLGLSG
jgi:hypothetical protein